jgi:hypothetical protein
MKRTIISAALAFAAALAPLATFAEAGAPNWLVDTMYRSGKITTVVIVMSVVLIGIAAWMFGLDRRITKLERNRS